MNVLKNTLITITTSIFLLSCSFLFGCTDVTQSNVNNEHEIELIINSNYVLDNHYFKDYTFNKPSGIYIKNDIIIISDSTNNCLVLFDLNGAFIREIGSVGNGELEFLHPTSINFNGEYYIILDSGNNRVQLLNENFIYVDEIQLPNNFTKYNHYIDIASDENNIYATTNNINVKNSKLYMVDIDKKIVHTYGSDINGYLSLYNGNIYYYNSLELIHDKKSDTGRNGNNYMYNFVDGQTNLIRELPYKYCPQDFLYTEDKIYIISDYYSSVDTYSIECDYIETLYKFEEYAQIRYLAYDEQNDIIYFTSPENSAVYRLYKG